MKKDKTQIKKLLELEHLINTGGDKARIAELRKELGAKERREVRDSLLEKQYFRLRAFGLTDREIIFALATTGTRVQEMKDVYTLDELDERVKEYDEHRFVKNYWKQRKRKWRNL